MDLENKGFWRLLNLIHLIDEKCEYKVPFQDEVGFNPSLDEMKVVVVDKCQRPIIKQEWLQNNVISVCLLFFLN